MEHTNKTKKQKKTIAQIATYEKHTAAIQVIFFGSSKENQYENAVLNSWNTFGNAFCKFNATWTADKLNYILV